MREIKQEVKNMMVFGIKVTVKAKKSRLVLLTMVAIKLTQQLVLAEVASRKCLITISSTTGGSRDHLYTTTKST